MVDGACFAFCFSSILHVYTELISNYYGANSISNSGSCANAYATSGYAVVTFMSL